MKKICTLILAGICALTSFAQSNTDPGVVINGVKWATRNVDDVGTFAAAPESYGKYYQWNRKVAYPTTGTAANWDSSLPSGTEWTAENDPCPQGWRMPTENEQCFLFDGVLVSKTWTTRNGINGVLFTDLTTNYTLFLPLAGYRDNYPDSDGFLRYQNQNIEYWSSTVSSFARYAEGITGFGEAQNIFCSGGNYRFTASSVRCVQDLYYSVNIAQASNGSVSASSTSVIAGTTITLTITPATGYELENIETTPNVSLQGTGNTRTFQMPASNVTVTATFRKLPVVEITSFPIIYIDGGNLSNPIYPTEESAIAILPAKVTAYTANNGTVQWDVISWKVNGKYDLTQVDNAFLGTLGAAPAGYANSHSYVPVAHIKMYDPPPAMHNVYVTPTANGSIRKIGSSQNVAVNTYVVFTVTPDASYELENIETTPTVNIDHYYERNEFAFYMPNSDITVKATFRKQTAPATEITGFASIANLNGGTSSNPTYTNAAAVIAALPKTVTANYNGGTVQWNVSTWTDINHYNPNAAGTYGFTAVLGAAPTGYANSGNHTARVNVVVNASSSYPLDIPQPANGNISVSPGTNVAAGTTVTLTITPASGYELDNIWTTPSVSLQGTGNTRTFQMPASPITVTATFRPSSPSYSVNITQSDYGYISSSHYTDVPFDEIVTLTFAPDQGYELENIWTTPSLSLYSEGNPNVIFFYMPASDVTVTADFRPLPPAAVEITGFASIANLNGGTSSNPTYASAAAVIAALPKTVTANHNGGTVQWNVSAWTDADRYNPNVAGTYGFTAVLGTAPTGYANSGSHTVKVNVVVNAPLSYSVNMATTSNGSVSANPNIGVTAGTTVRLTITPAKGYELASIGTTPSVSLQGTGNTRSFQMPASNVTVTATFRQLPLSPVEITGFASIANLNGGTSSNPTYSSAAAVIAALPKTVTANYNGGTVQWNVTTWTDADRYNPNVAGTYRFTAVLGTAPTGYANSGNHTVRVNVVVKLISGINSIVNEELKITVNGDLLSFQNLAGLNSVQVFDVMGRALAVWTLRAAPTQNGTQTINVSHLPSGIYLLKVNTEKGVKTERFVKK